MLSDSDRMKLQNDECYTHAIGYAMKGNSLNVKTMCHMINLLLNTLHNKDIPILCECFDRQWANLAFKVEQGLSLNFTAFAELFLGTVQKDESEKTHLEI